MKAKKVSALRERGLRPDVGRETEPQVSESINSIERKTDTMKTYLLRDPNTVEPQKPRGLEPPAPGPSAACASAKAPRCSSAWTCITIRSR